MAQMASVVDGPADPAATVPLPTSATSGSADPAATVPLPDLDEGAVPDPSASASVTEPLYDLKPEAPKDLPVIAVEGVNADEAGHTFRAEDFSDDPRSFDRDVPIETNPEEGSVLYPGLAESLKRQASRDEGASAPLERSQRASYGTPHPGAGSDDIYVSAGQQRAFRAPDEAPRKRRGRGRRVLVIVLVLVVVAAGVVGATYQLGLWGGKVVPSVVGRTQTDAVYMLEQDGFTVVVKLVKSDATEGIVLSQSPAADSKTTKGAEVVIRVSSARVVPEVIGLSRSEAVTLLEEEGILNVSVVTEESDEQAGTVISVTPEEGEKVEASTSVTLVVATPYTVPDVTGMTAEEAEATLEESGYVVVVSTVYDDTVEAGTVVSTSRSAGAVLAKGSTVTIYVAQSRADELVAATYEYLNSLETIELSGTTFEIVSVDGVTYAGDDTLAFTITAHAVTWLDGEQVSASDRQVNGTIIWDEDDNIVSVF